MERKVVLVVVVLIVSVLAAFLVWNNLSKPALVLPAYYVSLSDSWKNVNYEPALFHEDPESLLQVEPSRLAAIRSNLEAKKSVAKEPIEQELISVYESYLELVQETQKLQVIQQNLEELDDLCANQAEFLSFATQLDLASGKLRVFAEKTNAFANAHPAQTQEIFLYPVGNDYEKRLAELDAFSREYELALGVCQ